MGEGGEMRPEIDNPSSPVVYLNKSVAQQQG